MLDRLVWEKDGRNWPLREASGFVQAAGLQWHVVQMGSGPVVLLIHGTGSSTHSWRQVAPLLAHRFTVVAPDLPGHAFTDPLPSRGPSLTGMAAALRELLQTIGLPPQLVVGHSAGAAILARMSLDGDIGPRGLVSVNGALLPLRGVAGHVFSPIAKLLALHPLVPRLFAWRASEESAVQRLIRSTGSTLDPAGVELYRRLVRNPAHVAAALSMMANWDLRELMHDLPYLKPPLTLVVGDNDQTVPPSEAPRVKALLPSAAVVSVPGLGHLAHEESPGAFADLMISIAASLNL